MVLNITLERDDIPEDAGTDVYTLHVESHRILTVVTYSDTIVRKWLKQAIKSTVAKTTVLVGVAAEEEHIPSWFNKPKEAQYETLCLSIGSHTLIYEVLDEKPNRFLASFFQDPRVVAIGRDMANVSRKLRANNGIEIRNAVDVNDLAVKGLGRDDLDLCRYDLDRLAMAVLGKHMDLDRPEGEGEFPDLWEGFYRSRCCEKVKFSWAVDPYLCFLMGEELIDAIDGAAGFKKKKEGKKSK